MSIQAVGWALDQELPARPKLVLVSLSNHADKITGYCWLNATTIAQEAACKPRSVYRFIAALVHNGYVRREKRRGADGKQRANDYWLLFNRTEAPWVELGSDHVPEDEIEANAESHGSEDGDIQDVDGENPSRLSSLSPGECAEPVTRQDEKIPAPSLGPGDNRVSHIDPAEPSKIKPENVGPTARIPRGYRPPPPTPPPPMGSTTCDGSGPMIFVYAGTRAYESWAKFREAERVAVRDYRPFKSITSRNGEFGWYFPSLFPPQAQGPPAAQRAAEEVIDPI